MPEQPAPSIAAHADATRFVLTAAAPADFEILLQGGFFVPVEGDCTVRELLCEHMEICGDYAKERIQTLFLNGSVVDDMDSSWVRQGSRLALSAAMPGLVGATMRRGGAYAAMREGITYQPREITLRPGSFLVQIRLYNFIARELAELFLTRGVWLRTPDLLHFLLGRPASFFEGVAMSIDGRTLPPGRPDLDRLAGLRELSFLRLDRPTTQRTVPARTGSKSTTDQRRGAGGEADRGSSRAPGRRADLEPRGSARPTSQGDAP